MLTSNNTERAIQALKRGDTRYFHGSLCDYLIEVLESLDLPPMASEGEQLKQELRYIIKNTHGSDEQVEEIEILIDEYFTPSIIVLADKEQPLHNKRDSKFELKDWHLNILTSVVFIFVLSWWYFKG